jgi:hypothetical protein
MPPFLTYAEVTMDILVPTHPNTFFTHVAANPRLAWFYVKETGTALGLTTELL